MERCIHDAFVTRMVGVPWLCVCVYICTYEHVCMLYVCVYYIDVYIYVC